MGFFSCQCTQSFLCFQNSSLSCCTIFSLQMLLWYLPFPVICFYFILLLSPPSLSLSVFQIYKIIDDIFIYAVLHGAKYASSHEWVKHEDKVATVGITHHAQVPFSYLLPIYLSWLVKHYFLISNFHLPTILATSTWFICKQNDAFSTDSFSKLEIQFNLWNQTRHIKL